MQEFDISTANEIIHYQKVIEVMSLKDWLGWRGRPGDFIASWIQLFSGLLIAAMGWTLMLRSELGMGPWGGFSGRPLQAYRYQPWIFDSGGRRGSSRGQLFAGAAHTDCRNTGEYVHSRNIR